MTQENTQPKDRLSAVKILAAALAKAAPEFGETIDATSIDERSTLDCHWKFRVCNEESKNWPYQLDQHRKGWDNRVCIGDYLNRFVGLPLAASTS